MQDDWIIAQNRNLFSIFYFPFVICYLAPILFVGSLVRK